jgi:hypothetical protein
VNEAFPPVISPRLWSFLDQKLAVLHTIREKNGDVHELEGQENRIKQVQVKFMRLFFAGARLDNAFTRRELRLLSYALNVHRPSIFEHGKALSACLALLDDQWRNTYLSGLLICYLGQWHHPNRQSVSALGKLVIRKIQEYQGGISRYTVLKNHVNHFHYEGGDIRLGANLAIRRASISEVTKHLSLPDRYIQYPYFRGVFEAYVEKSKEQLHEIMHDIAHALSLHSKGTPGTPTNKLIISKMICQCLHSPEGVQNKLKDYALRLVGDPGMAHTWDAFSGATMAEQAQIAEGRRILNEWITRQFIHVFFKTCIDEPRRRNFWIKYSGHIRSFVVFGNMETMQKLKADERIAAYVDGRFVNTGDQASVSAFMFLMDKYKMIEFSVQGYAFYVYLERNTNVPSIELKQLRTVNQFRNKHLNRLVIRKREVYELLSEEGRFFHIDGDISWEERLHYWIRKKTGIHV